MDQLEAAQAARKTTYTIDGVVYRLEPLSWQQNKWLAEHIFRDIDLERLDYAVIHDLLRDRGPLFMAICLLREGQTRKEQAKLPFSAIHSLAEDFAGSMTGGEVAQFGPHFFICNQPAQLAMLVKGKVLVQEIQNAGESSRPPGATMSSARSSPSLVAILPSSSRSSQTSDPTSPNSISGDALNEPRSIEPSSDGVVLSSHG